MFKINLLPIHQVGGKITGGNHEREVNAHLRIEKITQASASANPIATVGFIGDEIKVWVVVRFLAPCEVESKRYVWT